MGALLARVLRLLGVGIAQQVVDAGIGFLDARARIRQLAFRVDQCLALDAVGLFPEGGLAGLELRPVGGVGREIVGVGHLPGATDIALVGGNFAPVVFRVLVDVRRCPIAAAPGLAQRRGHRARFVGVVDEIRIAAVRLGRRDALVAVPGKPLYKGLARRGRRVHAAREPLGLRHEAEVIDTAIGTALNQPRRPGLELPHEVVVAQLALAAAVRNTGRAERPRRHDLTVYESFTDRRQWRVEIGALVVAEGYGDPCDRCPAADRLCGYIALGGEHEAVDGHVVLHVVTHCHVDEAEPFQRADILPVAIARPIRLAEARRGRSAGADQAHRLGIVPAFARQSVLGHGRVANPPFGIFPA